MHFFPVSLKGDLGAKNVTFVPLPKAVRIWFLVVTSTKTFLTKQRQKIPSIKFILPHFLCLKTLGLARLVKARRTAIVLPWPNVVYNLCHDLPLSSSLDTKLC